MTSKILFSRLPDVAASVRKAILSPLVSGPLLLLATYAPTVLDDALGRIAQCLHRSAEGSIPTLAKATTAIKVLFALSMLRQANLTLNVMSLNSWRLRKASGWDWPREVAVVTGGSSGIGQGIVERLVDMRVRVAVLDIQDLPKSMQNNPDIRFYKCDVSSGESLAAAAEAIREDLGHPSILVNNAGITKPLPILKMPEEYLRKIFGVNIMSHWLTTQQFLPRMIQLNKGHVVTIASISSYVALPTAADYSSTKAAVLAFHESLACELKHYYKARNVLTTVVLPNFVRTPLLSEFGDRLESSGVRMLTSDMVADEVVSQIHSRRGGHLIIPDSASIIAGIRGWPSWMQEGLRDMLGRSPAVA